MKCSKCGGDDFIMKKETLEGVIAMCKGCCRPTLIRQSTPNEIFRFRTMVSLKLNGCGTF